MDRQIVYVGAIPLDTDQLLQSRNTMVALGYFAKMAIGDSSGYADGFACSPGNGLSVVIGPGSMTLPTVIDGNSYGALPPDGEPLVKIGVNTTSVTLALPGVGETVISAAVVETQAGSSAVSYYNPSNPTQTLIGAQGSGQAQATVVQQRVAMLATPPALIPTGYTPLWQVTVPENSSSVDVSMIAAVTGAPFVTVKLPQAAPLLSPNFAGVPTAPTPVPGDSSASLATTSFVTAAISRNRAAWGTGGNYTWTCPLGVSTVLVRAWAAGGRGGDAGSGFPGGGGGGGGYEEVLLSVAPAAVYAVQIGNGTSGSTSTSFDQRVVVAGGINGQSGVTGESGTGGGPGAPSSNNINSIASIGVGSGQNGLQFAGINIGGAGGSSFGVQGAPACFGGTGGATGLWPGGGGSGGGTGIGGKGADGLLVLEWNG